MIVVSYSLAPSDETLRSVLISQNCGPHQATSLRLSATLSRIWALAVTVRDPKVSAYRWWNAQAVSDNFAHATARNLAQQAAVPSDLETPRVLGDPNPQAAIGAVDRYQRGSVRPFGDVSLEAGGGKSK